MNSLYEQYKETKRITDEAYKKLKQEEGRFVIGPSNASGIYIKDIKATEGTPQITHIERNEAIFIVLALTRIYGLK